MIDELCDLGNIFKVNSLTYFRDVDIYELDLVHLKSGKNVWREIEKRTAAGAVYETESENAISSDNSEAAESTAESEDEVKPNTEVEQKLEVAQEPEVAQESEVDQKSEIDQKLEVVQTSEVARKPEIVSERENCILQSELENRMENLEKEMANRIEKLENEMKAGNMFAQKIQNGLHKFLEELLE